MTIPENIVQLRGRGASFNPPNRFEPVEFEWDGDELDRLIDEDERLDPGTKYFVDSSRTIIARNDSPDVGFETSINPYRGCVHGCVYCFARPFHDYLGFSSGLDFESRIMVKTDAPALLRRELQSKNWKPQVIVMSGVTDPYQPVERKLGITRKCLEILRDYGNPVGIITKNHLVTRDVDILSDMASRSAAMVSVSITSLRRDIQRVMEPRASTPERRLKAVEVLTKAGVPVNVMVAPVVPGLTDEEIPSIVQAAADAGARTAGYIVLRLPHAVKDLFGNWLAEHFPERAGKVTNRIKDLRDGQMYYSAWGTRMSGSGVYAAYYDKIFESACARAGLNQGAKCLSVHGFRRPEDGNQLRLL